MSDTPSKPKLYAVSWDAVYCELSEVTDDNRAFIANQSSVEYFVPESALVAAQAELSEAAETIELYAAEAEIRKHWAEELKAELKMVKNKFENSHEARAALEDAIKRIDELGMYCCDDEGRGHECPAHRIAHATLKGEKE